MRNKWNVWLSRSVVVVVVWWGEMFDIFGTRHQLIYMVLGGNGSHPRGHGRRERSLSLKWQDESIGKGLCTRVPDGDEVKMGADKVHKSLPGYPDASPRPQGHRKPPDPGPGS